MMVYVLLQLYLKLTFFADGWQLKLDKFRKMRYKDEDLCGVVSDNKDFFFLDICNFSHYLKLIALVLGVVPAV